MAHKGWQETVTEGMWQIVSELLDGEKLPCSMNEALAGLCDGSLYIAPSVGGGRTISCLLTRSDEGGFGYNIRVDGRSACCGTNFRRAIDAYKAAVEQFQFNEDSFPLDCPDPFASEKRLDILMTRLSDQGLRDT